MKAKILKSLLIIALASALAGGATYLLFEGTGTGDNIILNSCRSPIQWKQSGYEKVLHKPGPLTW